MYRTKLKKNKKYANFVIKKEIKNISYKYLLWNNKVTKEKQYLLNYYNIKKMSKYFKTRIVNYCVISNNPRGVFKKIYYSKQNFKKAATLGTFAGIRKACW